MVCARRRCRAVSSVPCSSSVMPITPFIGVRISWLILARNSLLALLARSAASLARGCLADGLLQFPVGVGEIDGALLDLLLEELPVPLEPRIALPDLPEHLIEASMSEPISS